MLKTKVSSSADIIKKNLGWYLNYQVNQNYKYIGNLAKTIPLDHWATIQQISNITKYKGHFVSKIS